MKFPVLGHLAVLILSSTLSSPAEQALSASVGASPIEKCRDNGNGNSPEQRRLTMVQTEPCIMLNMQVKLSRRQPSVSRWRCELSERDAVASGQFIVDLQGIPAALLERSESGRSTFFSNEAIIREGVLVVPPTAQRAFDIAEPRGPATMSPPSLTDNRLVLAVRVNGADVLNQFSESKISDEVFGTQRDSINLKERYSTCSFGQMTVEPYAGTTSNGVDVSNGVTNLTLNVHIQNANVFDIETAARNVLASKLGSLATQFDHVMLCLPRGTLIGTNLDWLAYAYLGHYLSVYNDEWCNNPSAQARAIGHNLGLNNAHKPSAMTANLGEYEDQIGFMGFANSLDDPRLCFNAVQSYNLGWYRSATVELDIFSRGNFNGKFVGITYFNATGTEGYHIIARIPAPSPTGLTYFVSFNLAAGINADSIDDAPNKVAVHFVVPGSARSFLMAELATAQAIQIANFLVDDNLQIRVNSIDLDSKPPVADVDIFLASCSPGECSPLSAQPPIEPSLNPTPSTTSAPISEATQTSPVSTNFRSSVPTTFPLAEEPELLGPSRSPTHEIASDPMLQELQPSFVPTDITSSLPTISHSAKPSVLTSAPSPSPTSRIASGTMRETLQPSTTQTNFPTNVPTLSLSLLPSDSPFGIPTMSLTAVPSELTTVSTPDPTLRLASDSTLELRPSSYPTTDFPSDLPTISPTFEPSYFPSSILTTSPSVKPPKQMTMPSSNPTTFDLTSETPEPIRVSSNFPTNIPTRSFQHSALPAALFEPSASSEPPVTFGASSADSREPTIGPTLVSLRSSHFPKSTSSKSKLEGVKSATVTKSKSSSVKVGKKSQKKKTKAPGKLGTKSTKASKKASATKAPR